MRKSLYYGDNLDVLRNEIASASVDLIYLDPPFNSNASYNVLFRNPGGKSAGAQIEAFEDTWHWGEPAEDAFDQVMHSGATGAADMLRSLRGFLGENDMMAYLAMMAVRLIELRRVLKPTGSLYLHCDPTASHYLRIMLDGIFSPENFVNEVVWKRTSGKSDYVQGATHWPRLHDTIFYYQNDIRQIGELHPVFSQYSREYIDSKYPHTDAAGRRYGLWDMSGPGGAANGNPSYEVMGITRFWRFSRENMDRLLNEGRVVQPRPGAVPRYKRFLDEMPGIVMGDWWEDLSPVNSQARERLGYPTQKPVALLERIIAASSNRGDVVLDPFCGCGTAIHAAEKLHRDWIGIDITHLAISLIERRLRDAFPGIAFDVHGTPKDIEAARDLATRDKYQFQWWAVSLVNAQPFGGKKRGADSGIDGKVFFKPDGKRTEVAIVSVKGGDNINVGMVRDLKGVIEREKAPMGLFLTLAPSTAPMRAEAASAGFYETLWGRHPRLQILTIAELLAGKRPDMPLVDVGAAFRPAAREQQPVEQGELVSAAAAAVRAPRRSGRAPKRKDGAKQRELLLPIEGSGESAAPPIAAPQPARRRALKSA